MPRFAFFIHVPVIRTTILEHTHTLYNVYVCRYNMILLYMDPYMYILCVYMCMEWALFVLWPCTPPLLEKNLERALTFCGGEGSSATLQEARRSVTFIGG